MLYFRLGYGVDLALALSNYTTGLFPTLENRDLEMIQRAVNGAWYYPGIPYHRLKPTAQFQNGFRGEESCPEQTCR